MSISKLRGKSAIGQPHDQKFQTKSSYLPQTSLLKIEPFVPSFTTHLRRPIHRSYSTLSSTYFKRAIDQNKQNRSPICVNGISGTGTGTGTGTSVGQKSTKTHRNHSDRSLIRQRSKSSLSSSSANGSGTISQQQIGGGICKIQRSQKEQEKLPDRINYDRRGLTAIPIFENEKNLRLLSLQHNLINVFHLIDDDSDIKLQDGDDNYKDNGEKVLNPEQQVQYNEQQKQQMDKINRHTVEQNKNGFKRTIIPPSPSSSPISPNAAKPNNILLTPSTSTSPLGTNNNRLNNNNHIPTIRNSFVQKSVMIYANQKYYSMKKSKSFMTNYSKHLNNIRRNIQNCTFIKGVPNGAGSGNNIGGLSNNLNDNGNGNENNTSTINGNSLNAINRTSFDSTDNGPNDMDLNCSENLKIENNQLYRRYGNVFQNLVFLDLYDNQIEKIANLDGLKSLTVLLLGKNRISDITGLSSLKSTLRVLDLHGNKITSITNRINCLQELKSLNLAGNQIRQINPNDFAGLMNLKELNLKRNKIKRVYGFNHLTCLERLWLCHNDLHKVDDMSSIAKAINLQEVTIENNPVSLAGDCVSFLVSYLPKLLMLSQMPITDQVRRAAMAWRKNKEISDSNYSNLTSDVFNNIRREEVISNARTNWELLRSQQMVSSSTASSYLAANAGNKGNCNRLLMSPTPLQNLSEIIVQNIGTVTTTTTTTTPTMATTSNPNGLIKSGSGRKIEIKKIEEIDFNTKILSMTTTTTTALIQQNQENHYNLQHNNHHHHHLHHHHPQNQYQTKTTNNDETVNENGHEFIRFPPIVQPSIICPTNITLNSNPPSEKTHSSGSSLGPNIDSSISSCFSSDNEERETINSNSKRCQEETVRTKNIYRNNNVHSARSVNAAVGLIRVPQINEQPPFDTEHVSYDMPTTKNDYKEVYVIEEKQTTVALSSSSSSSQSSKTTKNRMLSTSNANNMDNINSNDSSSARINKVNTSPTPNTATTTKIMKTKTTPAENEISVNESNSQSDKKSNLSCVNISIKSESDTVEELLLNNNNVDSPTTNIVPTVKTTTSSIIICSNNKQTTKVSGSELVTMTKTTPAVLINQEKISNSKSQRVEKLLGSSHNNSTGIGGNLNVNSSTVSGSTSTGNINNNSSSISTTKRYMHGSLIRSQTTKPTKTTANVCHNLATNNTTNGLSSTSTNNNNNDLSNNLMSVANTTSTNITITAAATITTTATATTTIPVSIAPTTTTTASIQNHNQSLSASSINGATTLTTTSTVTGSLTIPTTTTIGNSNKTVSTKQIIEREREQGGDYLIEICGRYLNIYGQGALRFIDKQWNTQKANDVHTLNFSYINFNNISTILCRIKMRFPHAENFVFRETNISCLGQLNALAELQGISTLVIDSEGNSITIKDWRPYAVYRLSHWGLKSINGTEITENEIELAQKEYMGLSELVLWSLPESMLQPLLTRLRLDETCSASKLSAKDWLMNADQSLKIVVGKEALQWKKNGNNFDEQTIRERGKMHFSVMIENTFNAVEKLQKLESLWPSLLLDIVRNTLLDYSQLEVYLKRLLAEVMK